jgi:hypothetical protein
MSELNSRFNENNDSVISKLKLIIPKYYFTYVTSDDKILNAAQIYEADLPHSIEALRGELNLWKQFWKNKPEKAESSMEAFKYASMFPNIKCLLTILSVIHITTASAERSFSSLKRIKTYLRSTMGQERLNGLAMLRLNKDIQVKPGEILDVFTKNQTKTSIRPMKQYENL